MELVDLAQNYFGDTRTGNLTGPFSGFLVLVLVVFTVLLIRNMNARIRRLPERFPAPDAEQPPEATGAEESPTSPRTARSAAPPAD